MACGSRVGVRRQLTQFLSLNTKGQEFFAGNREEDANTFTKQENKPPLRFFERS